MKSILLSLIVLLAVKCQLQNNSTTLRPILPGSTFDYQIGGFNPQRTDVNVYVFDGFRVNRTITKKLRDDGHHVICFYSAGTIETFSPDYNSFLPLKGKPVIGQTEIFWINLRNDTLLKPLMEARIRLAKENYCSGIDFSNTNSYTQDTGFDLSLTNAFLFIKKLSDWTKEEGLLIGLNNNPALNLKFGDSFDFRIATTCTFDKSCDQYKNFTQTNKPVFGLEYVDANSDSVSIAFKCNSMFAGNITGIVRDYTLDSQGFFFQCPARKMEDSEAIPNIQLLKSVGVNPFLESLRKAGVEPKNAN